MNGEDVVIGGRYVVGPEPTYRCGGGRMRSSAKEGEVRTVTGGPDSDGDFDLDEGGAVVSPEYLTPYVGPDAAGDESAHDTLLKRAEKVEAELAALHSWDGMLRLLDQHWPTDIFGASHDPDLDPGARIVNLIRALNEAKSRGEKAEADRDQAVSDLYDEAERHFETGRLLNAERVKVQRLDEAVAQLRAAPQLPADLPVVESVETRTGGAFLVKFERGSELWVGGEFDVDARTLAAAGLAVLAAEAAKPDPVEELARVLENADYPGEDDYSVDYATLARAAIEWTEKRDA